MEIPEILRHPLPDNDDTFEVVRSVRDLPPAHYTMKIESFSLLSQLLQSTGVEKYDSKAFEAGGYKWKLVLYPSGNKKRHVKGHISLYLAMEETKNLTLGIEINVILKFFVFDQIREKYLTLEDKRMRPFNALKTERGISRLLSLSTLNDPSNGYLIDDCCIFGVEVFVVNCGGKGESLTMIKEPVNATFTWKIDKFSGLKQDELLYSEGFTVGGWQWKLMMYPNGGPKQNGKNLSLYLSLYECFCLLRVGWKLFVEFKLCIKDQVHGRHYEQTVKNWFCSSAKGWGYPDFIALSDLKDENMGFIVNDTLIVGAKITFMSVVNSFP